MGMFTLDLLTGSQYSTQQKSAKCLNESLYMNDKTTSLLLKTHKDSFGYLVQASQHSGNTLDNMRHTLS